MTEAQIDAPPTDAGSHTKSENARLRGELARAEARAERAERALDRMERSAKYTVGALLVDAAKSPKRLLLLPRDLWRVWRLRKSRRTAVATAPKARSLRDDILDREAARLLLPRIAARPGSAFSIAGALSAETALAWSSCAAVTQVQPHDAAELVLATDPDLVVIESAAGLPGEQWSFLGDPAAADRQLAAMRLIDAAREQGRPVVLVRNTSPAQTAFLSALERECDLVVDGPGSRRQDPWLPGIDLEAWIRSSGGGQERAAVVLEPASGSDPLDGGRTPAERALASALRAALHDQGTLVLEPDPRLPMATARRQALGAAAFGIATPLRLPADIMGARAASLAVLASGRRLLGPADVDLSRVLVDAREAYVQLDAARLAYGIDAALAPVDDHLRRGVLRGLLLRASAPGQLQVLADRLGLLSRPRACWDVSLICEDPDIDAVLLQSWRPRELVVPAPPADRARKALEEHGVHVVVSTPPVPRSREALSLACGSPFVATQVDLTDPDAIADLLVEHLAGLPPVARLTDAALWSRA